ncbi:hypothetical protein NGB74_02585 [Staphylococcus chromogenes]|uniref:hypothetical protein n=1 Tax=Staphylococcus chromogenes TaxID=46126 RepID=UPI002DBDCB13|nr:hypothetical protein [Staphylococcus chromogenes]MEB7449897.1 hypothetical protein [Staphylococcus chromogenes]
MNTLINLGERIIQLEKERDTLIEDITRLRAERNQYLALAKDYKTLIDYKVECNPGNMNYKKLKQKIDEVLKDDK